MKAQAKPSLDDLLLARNADMPAVIAQIRGGQVLAFPKAAELLEILAAVFPIDRRIAAAKVYNALSRQAATQFSLSRRFNVEEHQIEFLIGDLARAGLIYWTKREIVPDGLNRPVWIVREIPLNPQ